MYDAIVIGGGLLGLSTAYHLVREGSKVLLVDRQDPGQATDASAGILAPEVSTRDAPGWYEFATQAVDYYPTFIQALTADQEGETGYAACRLLFVAVSDDELEIFEEAKAGIFDRQTGRAGSSGERLVEISAPQARMLFPPLAPVLRVIHHPKAGRVDARRLAGAVRHAAERRGLVVKRGNAERLILNDHRFAGVMIDGQALSSRSVVIAGGAWSSSFGEQLGLRLPVEPQRGQIIHLRVRNLDISGWPVILGLRGYYIVPWPDGRVVVGATRETGSGFDPRLTAGGVHEVLAEALRMAPGLATEEIHEMRVGLRPMSADSLPILGPAPNWDGAYLATGHGAAGLQLGPYSGKVVADLILGKVPDVDIAAFRVARFQA